MSTPTSLDILFLTSFSDYCFRAVPAIAQIADTLPVRLTIMHVFDPALKSESEASAQVHSFFPEADRYAACHRLAAPGPVMSAVRRHLELWPVNLIVAPASDPIGLPRLGDRSLRSRLIDECGVPLWTIGRRTQLPKLTQPARRVACWLDFHSRQNGHLAFAIEYAHKLNAQLHILRALPTIQEGSLVPIAHQNQALHPDGAVEEILQQCASAPIRPKIHVSTGEGRPALARMLRECDADIAFLANEESLFAQWFGLGLRLGDGIPCPAVYVGKKLSVPLWNFDAGSTSRIPVAVRHDAGVRELQPVAGARNGSGMRDPRLVASSRNGSGGILGRLSELGLL